MKPLNAYEWPGNVRELRKIVSRLVIFHSMRNQLSAATVEGMLEESRALLAQAAKPSRPTGQATRDPERADQGRRESGRAEQVGTERARREPARTEPGGPEGFQAVPLGEGERRHILDTLESTGGIISGPFGAAAVLGLPRSTLQHRMRKLGIGRRRRTGAEV